MPEIDEVKQLKRVLMRQIPPSAKEIEKAIDSLDKNLMTLLQRYIGVCQSTGMSLTEIGEH